MALNHISKYPKIIIDESDQSINPFTKKELTVEEWYDIRNLCTAYGDP